MKKRKFLAVLASCAVMVGMFPMTASAANYSATIDGEKNVSFDKYLVMKNAANVPEAEFEFTIAPGAAVATADGKMEVLAGVGTPKFVVEVEGDETVDAKDNKGTDTKAKVEFNSADTAAAENTAGEKTVKFVTTDDTDEKFVTKTVSIDFSSVVFPEPGVYRYVITEEAQAVAVTGVTNDAQTTRTLDVYVVDDSDATERKLKINSYVIHTGLEAPARNDLDENNEYKENAEKLADKSTGFTNTYSTQDLEFGKEVTGNQGSKDKYFKFTLTVTNAKGATFDVITTNMETTPVANVATVYDSADMAAANSADDNANLDDGQQIVVDSTGTVTKVFYLNDGQYVKILGLPTGAKYTVTEVAEDYQSADGTDKVWQAAVGTEGEEGYQAAKTYSDSTNGTITTADIHTGYTNNRSGAIPTGVILSVAAPVVIGLAVLGGIIFLVIKNKKRDTEEEE